MSRLRSSEAAPCGSTYGCEWMITRWWSSMIAAQSPMGNRDVTSQWWAVIDHTRVVFEDDAVIDRSLAGTHR